MNLFKYLANLYKSKDALLNHITLFSLLGMLVIAVSSYLAASFGNIYGSFFDFISLNPLTLYLLLITGIMLLIFFIGYNYSVTNRMYYYDEALPELSLAAYYIFIKILPVLLIWKVYEAAFFMAGIVFIPITNLWFYLYYSVLICLLPFLSLIYSMFVKDFKYRAEVFSPFTILRVINRSLGSVIFLWFQVLIMLVIPCIMVYLLIQYSSTITNQTLQMGVKLGGVCIIAYLLFVIKLAYNKGLVEIVKTKFADV